MSLLIPATARCALLGAVIMAISSVQASASLPLQQAIEQAIAQDPLLQKRHHQQQATYAQGLAAGTLPDPKVSLSMMNLPVDSWQHDREAMTQLKVGVSQQFGRGDELALKREQLQIASEEYPLLRADRVAQIRAQVTQLWLDTYLAERTIALIEQDKALFEQLVDVSKASYANVVGRTRQQDVIRAQLELVQLDDRLSVEYQKRESARAQLLAWLRGAQAHIAWSDINLPETLPQLKVAVPAIFVQGKPDAERLLARLTSHPVVLAQDVRIEAAGKGVAIARQQYKPQWGVNASYGYRSDMPDGSSRADFFSLGVTLDVPLFTDNRQDQWLNSAQSNREAIKTDKLLLLRELSGQVEKEASQLRRLSERQTLFREQLLQQTHEQAEAALTAYTNDNGDFAEVVRARIAELNARVAAKQIDVDALKTVARLNYYLTTYQPGVTDE
ncbi:transporter [Pseudoalteromonas rubra]|uniref:Transporter n=1 Tax=Pseudoalteromonas rubra TaxID=43658 RepID=A0A5S3WNT5_9GAMM|nr:TolC family protein [Pseudoalteromonas rubra]TMP29674.1 transporter [Pseudoalteromonas rubra]TMP35267.1 transporter [Pseudoalteromonas rubra]